MKRMFLPRKKFFAALVILLFMAILIIPFSLHRGEGAYAEQGDLTVVQTGKTEYAAKTYVGTTGTFVNYGSSSFENELFASFSFYLGNTEIYPDPRTILFSENKLVRYPGDYSDTITFEYAGETYQAEVDFSIEKKLLVAQALINGETELTIKEGEAYSTSVQYIGFVGNDDESTLDAPAIITKEPKLPTPGYRIVPELARSSYYDFEYRAATIVILSNPDQEKKIKEGDVDVIVLTGSFSPYYTLRYKDIGVSATSTDYAAVSEKVERYYGTGSLFEKYDRSDCFSAELYLDGNTVDVIDPTSVRVLLDEGLRGKSGYVLIHFPTDGSEPELLVGTERNGYLSFSTVGLGTYVVLTPIEGANITLIIVIVIGIVAVVAIGVIFGAIFRRKY
ncbi:MAG: hypothetical protein IJ735_03515 [Clostridia bacterium]|nr:hypothetical protein [Clostridia bacterium]